MKLCLYQPDRHCRRPQAPTNLEHPKKPQTQPRDNKLEAEGPITSCSSGGSYGIGGGAGDLTSSRCFTWSSVLLLGGAMFSREKAKGQHERKGWQRALRAAASSQCQAAVGISYHLFFRGGKRQDPHG